MSNKYAVTHSHAVKILKCDLSFYYFVLWMINKQFLFGAVNQNISRHRYTEKFLFPCSLL